MPRPRALALVVAVLAGVAACSSSAAPRPASGWRIVYRIDDTAGPTPRVTTQVVEVLPPYGARSVIYQGAPPGGASLGGAAWVRGHQYLVGTDGSTREVALVAPSFAGPDAHLDVAMASALAHGLVRRGGTATVAGLPCTEWVSKEPLDAGDVAPPEAGESTTTCVDAQGRFLSDRWVISGKVVRARTAVSVGVPTSVPLLVTPTPLPGDQVPTVVKDVKPDVLAKALGIPTPSAPDGLRLDAATAMLDRNLFDGTGSPLREGGELTWSDGRSRLVTVQVMRGLVQPEPAPTTGVALTLSSGLAARLKPVVNGLHVQLLTPSGLSVDVFADLPEHDLLAWLGSLRWSRTAGP